LGVRISEAKRIVWRKVDWQKRELTIAGSKKRENDQDVKDRIFPFHDRLFALLTKLKTNHPTAAIADRIVDCNECRESLQNACARLKLGIRPHHHDMRHLAATWWVEAGVPIPTIAALLGHRNGGALLMRTYNHTRTEHLHQVSGKRTF